MKLNKRFVKFWNRVRCNLYADRPAWAVRVIRAYYNIG